jgi:hypothetical protein
MIIAPAVIFLVVVAWVCIKPYRVPQGGLSLPQGTELRLPPARYTPNNQGESQ